MNLTHSTASNMHGMLECADWKCIQEDGDFDIKIIDDALDFLHTSLPSFQAYMTLNASPTSVEEMLFTELLVMEPLQIKGRKVKELTLKVEPSTEGASYSCAIQGCQVKMNHPRGCCKKHGGKKLCGMDKCGNGAQKGGLCIRHGGGHRCRVDGCIKAAQTLGKCKSHGGGVRCSVPGCNKTSQGHKKCRVHGGGKRCCVVGCVKGVQKGGFCAAHSPEKHAVCPIHPHRVRSDDEASHSVSRTCPLHETTRRHRSRS
ncbi:hypothetical protein Ae201684P_009155 [Aphanomyces euteiches]|nr:hypothetical protein Ae201684P_009155 [Aphanomyces euteiches]